MMALEVLLPWIALVVAAEEPGREIAWAKGFEEARDLSKKAEKPLLVDFGAEWCGFCKKLDRETFSDEKVIRLVNESFVAVKVDVDKQPELKDKYSVGGLPTIVFLAPGGEELARLEGFRPPETFLKEARKPAESSAALQQLKDLAVKDPKDSAAQRAYGRALFAAGNKEAALKVLRGALGSLPAEAADAGLLLDLGDVQRASGDAASARDSYRRILAIQPEKEGDSRDKAFLPLATVLLSLKEQDAAVKVLDEFLANQSAGAKERLEALFLRGYIHAVRKDAEKAILDLKAARDIDPEGRWGQRAALILETVEVK